MAEHSRAGNKIANDLMTVEPSALGRDDVLAVVQPTPIAAALEGMRDKLALCVQSAPPAGREPTVTCTTDVNIEALQAFLQDHEQLEAQLGRKVALTFRREERSSAASASTKEGVMIPLASLFEYPVNELAAINAHEIGHVALDHSAERQKAYDISKAELTRVMALHETEANQFAACLGKGKDLIASLHTSNALVIAEDPSLDPKVNHNAERIAEVESFEADRARKQTVCASLLLRARKQAGRD